MVADGQTAKKAPEQPTQNHLQLSPYIVQPCSCKLSASWLIVQSWRGPDGVLSGAGRGFGMLRSAAHCLCLVFRLPSLLRQCLSLTYHCLSWILSLPLHGLSLPFLGLSLPFLDLPLRSQVARVLP